MPEDVSCEFEWLCIRARRIHCYRLGLQRLSAMSKLLNTSARTVGVIAALSAACTFAMTISLPYRVHQGIYTWYLWTERLLPFTILTGLVAIVSALILGIRSRQRLPFALAVISFALLFFSISHGLVHSGPNPQAWCYNHLREIEAAKSQFASENNLTNGATITDAQISKHIEGGFQRLKCAEGGKDTTGAVGTEARCSVHGSISEIEREWQKEMYHEQLKVNTNRPNKDANPAMALRLTIEDQWRGVGEPGR